MPANEPNYGAMSVKDLKARIERGGLTHEDCFETKELRVRAKEADEARKNGGSAASGKGAEQSDNSTLRERKPGKAGKASAEETAMLERITGLVTESTKVVGGRDASVILAEAEELKTTVADMTLTENGRSKMMEQLAELDKSLAFENSMEKNCGRIVQLGFLAVTIVPALLSCFEKLMEFYYRPEMVVEPANLSNMHAVITGGCGALGLELAIMLANSGAGVVISCHGPKNREPDEVESRLAKLGLLHGTTRSADNDPDAGWIKVWPLQLESFASVRDFASRVAVEMGTLDILVHNAATKEGCSRTVDGHDLVHQVNYLSPFLLNHLLLPAFREGSARIVHVTCDVGLQQPDWLPWPLRRTQPELLPHVDMEALKKRREGANATGECSPLVSYANSKLAILVHSHELNRHLTGYENRGVSHAVNPGYMDSAFGRSESVPAGKASARSAMMGYLPPVWMANQIYSFTLGRAFSGLGSMMLRKTDVGAKAVFHVATLAALGDEQQGGGLFADTAGMFTECQKEPGECGRVPSHKQPASAMDEELAAELWASTETAIGRKGMTPLPELPSAATIEERQ